MNNSNLFQKRYLIPIGTSLILGGLFFIAITNVFFSSKKITSGMITEEVAKLAYIFQRIDQTCSILSFDYQKNPINFLNVKTFTGSEVGPMNLVHPEKWEGPYLEDNPTIQGKEYQVVKTNQGYFITPGDGVKLPNGKIVGVDIVLDEKADIAALMRDENALMFQGKALAAPLGKVGQQEIVLGDTGA
ncbi:MAG: hypothetical protein Q8Q25_03385 [bacterium]|nr:hypothetical protein [bacterium]